MMSECEHVDNGVALSSASSHRSSNESLEENIRKILTSYEGNEMTEACRQLAAEGNSVGEFLMAQLRLEASQNPSEKMPPDCLSQNRRISTSPPEDLAIRRPNIHGKESEHGRCKKGPSKDTWELDSGTHDLGNCEPALQQLMTAAGTKGQSRSSNFLELANTLHLAALAALKSEIVELSCKIQQVNDERDTLQASLNRTNAERTELIRDYEERLLSQLQQSEEQLTELQSVIAELNKKLMQASANKIDELDEVESQTSEHGSRSSESLESIESNEDDLDEELSKVVGNLEFAIEREKPVTKEIMREKEPIKVTVKVLDGDKPQGAVEISKGVQQQVVESATEKKQQECEELDDRCRSLRVHCLELEKKRQGLERQLQQASLREYVARKKSSSFGSDGPVMEAPVSCSECEGLRTKLKTTTQELENARVENSSFKDERDRLRQRILEMQEHLKALHHKTIQYETNRARTSSLHDPSPQGSRSPRQQRANPPPTGLSPWESRSPHTGSRSFPRQSGYTSAASDISSRDGYLTSPRITRRSSTENVNVPSSRSPSTPRRSVTLPGNYGRRSSGGSMNTPWTSDGSNMTPRNPGSVQSISSQAFWRGVGTSDLGSSQGSTQEITVMARPVEEGIEARTSGDQCIRTLSQLPEFANGKLPSELIRALRGCKSVQDVYKVLFCYCDDQADKKLKEYELEMERLHSKVDHLEAQNNVITLSLEESRENAERMCILMGKYESNYTALQLSLSFCDDVIEAYDVLLQLSESEQACLYANCKAAGVKTGFLSYANSQTSPYRLMYHDDPDVKDRPDNDIEACLVRRRTAENEARILLQKFDRNLETQTNKEQPWESVSSHSRTSSGSSNDMEFTREEETRLKSYIQQLKSERSTVGSTVLELESFHSLGGPNDMPIEPVDPKLDLENAVLMQELMALKEEKAELKARNYLVEKEKKALELKINSREAQEQAYLVQIEHLKSEVRDELKKRRRLEKDSGNKDGNLSGNQSGSGGSGTLSDLRASDDDLPSDLHEAGRRERKLKVRIKELMEALESLSKNSENRHTQTAEYVCDLKRANGALVAAYEKAKKKHGARLRKLEQQMMTMVERHDAQVRTLKERISLLEEEITCRQNETAL